MKAQQAKQTEIWAIDANGPYKTNEYDFIIESATKTTTPDGVGYADFIREVDAKLYTHNESGEEFTEQELQDYNIYDTDVEYIGNRSQWELRTWHRDGRSHLIDTFDNEEDAEDRLWAMHMADFEADDQRDTAYYMTEAEAKQAWREAYIQD